MHPECCSVGCYHQYEPAADAQYEPAAGRVPILGTSTMGSLHCGHGHVPRLHMVATLIILNTLI